MAPPPSPPEIQSPSEEQSVLGLASFSIALAGWVAIFIGGLAFAGQGCWMVVAAALFCGTVLGVVALLISQRPKFLAGIGGIANLLAFLIVAGTVAGNWVSDGALGWSWTPLGQAHARFSAAILKKDLGAARAETTAMPELLTQCKKQNTRLLQVAVKQGTTAEVVDLLANQGQADVDALTDRTSANEEYRLQPPLAIAVRQKDQAVVAALLQAGADPRNLTESPDGPFAIALWLGDMEMAELLATRGAPRIAEEIDAQLPHAVRNKNETLVLWLLDHHAKIDDSTSEGTPLTLAVEAGNERIVDLLLARGANPNLLAGQKTPLLAAVTHRRQAIAERLLKASADPNSFLNDAEGHRLVAPPLHRAVELRSLEIVQVLLEHKADPNLLWPGDVPLTPLACAGNDQAIIDLLVRHGAKPPKPPKPDPGERPRRKRKKKDAGAPLA